MREYHIHVNGLAVSPAAATNLRGCGYRLRPFDFSVEGTCYTPLIHYSYKTNSESDFEFSFKSAELILSEDNSFIGYVEGEFVNRRYDIEPNSRSIERSQVDLRLDLEPAKQWREAEVHMVAQSGARITQLAQAANFYKSGIDKGGKLFEICTAQGTTQTIARLYDALMEFGQSFSDVPLSLKEEVLLKLFTSKRFNWLPPQVGSFHYHRVGQ
jgi:hypothetical protein